jgi:hypothetical protein
MKPVHVLTALSVAALFSGAYLAYSYAKGGGSVTSLFAAPIQAVIRSNAGGNGNNQNQSTTQNNGNNSSQNTTSNSKKNANGQSKGIASNSAILDATTISSLTPKLLDGSIAAWLAKPKYKFTPLSDEEASAKGLK